MSAGFIRNALRIARIDRHMNYDALCYSKFWKEAIAISDTVVAVKRKNHYHNQNRTDENVRIANFLCLFAIFFACSSMTPCSSLDESENVFIYEYKTNALILIPINFVDSHRLTYC